MISETSAAVDATPQHEPFWLVIPSDAISRLRSCDCELEITSPETIAALQPSRHLTRFLNARKGSAAFHDHRFVLPPRCINPSPLASSRRMRLNDRNADSFPLQVPGNNYVTHLPTCSKFDRTKTASHSARTDSRTASLVRRRRPNTWNCVADSGASRRRTSSVGLGRFHWTDRRRTRATCSTNTNKRRTCVELCASDGYLAATHSAQP